MTETNQTNAELIQQVRAYAGRGRPVYASELCDRLESADAEIERLWDDSEALAWLKEINHDDSFELFYDPDGMEWKVRDVTGDFPGIGKTPLEAIKKAKAAIEREAEQDAL